MNVVALAMLKDEQDVVESFARHALTFATRLVVGCDLCADRTPAIVAALVAEGLPIDVADRARSVNDLLPLAAVDADWLVPLEADEFLLTRDATGVREALADLDASAVYALPWRIYAPRDPRDGEGRCLPSRPAVRELRDQPLAKVIVGGRVARGPRLRLATANLGLTVGGTRCPLTEQSRLFLARYPVRSPEQYAAKIARSWAHTILQSPRHCPPPDCRAFEPCERNPAAMLLPWDAFLPSPCEPAPQGCRALALRYSDGTRPNFLRDILAARSLAAEVNSARF